LIIEKERRIPFMDSGQIFRLDAERPGGVTPQSVVTSRDDSMKILYKRLRPVNVALFYFKKALKKPDFWSSRTPGKRNLKTQNIHHM